MGFIQITKTPLRAPKLSGTGAVYYLMWHDENEEQYVQITRVVGGSGVGTGSWNNRLYPFNDIGLKTEYVGYDPASELATKTDDNNMSGFLRAAKKEILRKIEEEKTSEA